MLKILVNILCHDKKLKYLEKSFDSIREMNGNFDLKGFCFSDQIETIKFFQSKNIDVDCYDRPQKKRFAKNSFDLIHYTGIPEIELNQLSWLRNKCFEKAKEYDYLMFVDSDIILKKDMLEELLSANKQVIGGWYFNRRFPMLTAEFYDSNVDKLAISKKIYQVKTMGTGCALLRKDVFKKERFPEKNVRHGEDWSFYLDLDQKGYKIFCHTKFYCEHLDRFRDKAKVYRDKKIKEWSL